MADKPSKLKIADREFTSRLIVGTGKFASNELMRDALIASGAELVTVALRRADLSGKHDPFDFRTRRICPAHSPHQFRYNARFWVSENFP